MTPFPPFYGPEALGPVCRHCHHRVPLAIATNEHPSCGPEARALLLQDGAR